MRRSFRRAACWRSWRAPKPRPVRAIIRAARSVRTQGERSMRQKLLSRCLAAGLFAAAIVPATAEAEGAPMVIKLATATLNDAQHEWLKRFATMIDKDSNGRIKAQVFPASQLGSIPRMIEQTQFGSIQCWVGPPEFLSGVDMRYEVVSAPGLFKDI